MPRGMGCGEDRLLKAYPKEPWSKSSDADCVANGKNTAIAANACTG
jgi:hypothetical protein